MVKKDTLLELRRLYGEVYNHPFRVKREGEMASYGRVLIDLALAFNAELKDKKLIDSDSNYDFVGWYFHQFLTCGYCLTYLDPVKHDNEIRNYMIYAEMYLTQVHAYLLHGIFDSAICHYGYGKECTKTQKWAKENGRFRKVSGGID